MTSRFVSAAEEELATAAIFYERQQIILGEELLEAVEAAVNRLAKQPELGRPINSNHRRFVIQRFPYSIIYRIADNEIVIVAVAHQSRRPGYWKGRL